MRNRPPAKQQQPRLPGQTASALKTDQLKPRLTPKVLLWLFVFGWLTISLAACKKCEKCVVIEDGNEVYDLTTCGKGKDIEEGRTICADFVNQFYPNTICLCEAVKK